MDQFELFFLFKHKVHEQNLIFTNLLKINKNFMAIHTKKILDKFFGH